MNTDTQPPSAERLGWGLSLSRQAVAKDAAPCSVGPIHSLQLSRCSCRELSTDTTQSRHFFVEFRGDGQHTALESFAGTGC